MSDVETKINGRENEKRKATSDDVERDDEPPTKKSKRVDNDEEEETVTEVTDAPESDEPFQLIREIKDEDDDFEESDDENNRKKKSAKSKSPKSKAKAKSKAPTTPKPKAKKGASTASTSANRKSATSTPASTAAARSGPAADGFSFYYHRFHCKTCTKVDSWLERQKINPPGYVDARKIHYPPAEAVDIVRAKGVTKLLATKNTKLIRVDDLSETSDDALKKLIIGSAGNLRAPLIVMNDVMVIGFDERALKEAFGV